MFQQKICIHCLYLIFTISYSTLRQVHSKFRYEFYRQCDLENSFSVPSNFLFPYGHPVNAQFTSMPSRPS